MAKEITDHWSVEQKAAFDHWLAISIEMIEKYCFAQTDTAVEAVNLETDRMPPDNVLPRGV